MIVLHLPDRTLADREALEQLLDRPAATIRARCTPVAHDTTTRRALYDTEQVTQAMQGRQRRHHQDDRTEGSCLASSSS